MGDLGDGDLSLQRYGSSYGMHDDDDDDGEEALGSPHMTFEAAGSGDISAERARSYSRSYFDRQLSPQEDGHDIGEATIRGSLDEDDSKLETIKLEERKEDTLKTIPTPGLSEVRSGSQMIAARSEEVHDETRSAIPPPEDVTSPSATPRAPESPSEHLKVASGETALSEFSHQALTQQIEEELEEEDDGDVWQDMPVYAPYDVYDDDGKLVAREHEEEGGAPPGYTAVGPKGAAASGPKGYTKIMVDEDARSQTSMDEDTAYLFDKRNKKAEDDDDLEARDPLSQMKETKNMLTDNQRIAYVGVVRLAIAIMVKDLEKMERVRSAKKVIDYAQENMQLWSQKVMVRLYAHMELDPAEQLMIEQLAEHGLQPDDLTPSLMQNSRVKNPMSEPEQSKQANESSSASKDASEKEAEAFPTGAVHDPSEALPAYEEHEVEDMPEVRTLSQLPTTDKLDIDLRWTVLCDLFLLLISDSVYDSRSRVLLERVGAFMDVPWLDICKFEKRVTDALEMQDTELKEDLTEVEHMASRKKAAKQRKMVMMGLATVGGGLVIGLSAGLLAPVIGAGLVAGLGTIGVTSGGTFLAGVGGAALIGTTGAVSGGTIGLRAAGRRMGSVKTFEYRPLFDNRRVNLIITIAGWMTGKVDDVRLPYSTIDPIMGDIVSVLWEPDMLRSMGDTINILATEALTQGLQQILGSTILTSLMAALTLPVVLTKLAYLIDNPWSVSMARADMAGLIMADSLIDRNLGSRPITLVGFSLGSRVIFSCLRELARKGAVGIVQNVYIFGSPVVVKKEDWLKAQTVVSGRFVNGYATNDWILGYLFRATAGGIMRVAGLNKVEYPGIENFDVTELVPGHMSYRRAMPKCLRKVGWSIDSDEFTEIEDADPENHEHRQRELINEIEEARKDLQEKPEKKRWFWKSKQKRAQKKEWETYEERPVEPTAADYANDQPGGVLFDVEAIRREAVELAAQGIEIKELKSTQPPLRVNSFSSSNNSASSSTIPQNSSSSSPSKKQDLRGTKSYDTMPVSVTTPNNAYEYRNGSATASRSLDYEDKHDAREHNNHDYYDPNEAADGEGELSMTFEPVSPVRTHTMPLPDSRPKELEQRLSHKWSHADMAVRSGLSSPAIGSTSPSIGIAKVEQPAWAHDSHRSPDRNVWDDEDEFGREKELSMTFE